MTVSNQIYHLESWLCFNREHNVVTDIIIKCYVMCGQTVFMTWLSHWIKAMSLFVKLKTINLIAIICILSADQSSYQMSRSYQTNVKVIGTVTINPWWLKIQHSYNQLFLQHIRFNTTNWIISHATKLGQCHEVKVTKQLPWWLSWWEVEEPL